MSTVSSAGTADRSGANLSRITDPASPWTNVSAASTGSTAPAAPRALRARTSASSASAASARGRSRRSRAAASGGMTLIDADDICLSATRTGSCTRSRARTASRKSTSWPSARARSIPAIDIDAIEEFLTPSNLAALLDRGYDLVLDCCDAFRVKVEMIAWCRRRKIPLIVSGSAGGRTDPTLIAVRDLSKTEHDAMLALDPQEAARGFQFSARPEALLRRAGGLFARERAISAGRRHAFAARGRRCRARRGSSSIAAAGSVPRRT